MLTEFQIILLVISSFLIALAVFQLMRGIFIYKLPNQYFYFGLTALGGSCFIIFEILLANNISQEKILLFHRLRLASLSVCLISWFYCLFSIFFKDSKIPRYFLYINLLILLFIPTNLFLSYPTRHLKIEFLNIIFDYKFAKTNIIYKFFSLSVITFAIIAIIKILKSNIRKRDKVFAVATIFPMFSGINDFAVSQGIINNIMLSEFLTSIFIFSTSAIFFYEENQNNIKLSNMYKKLLEKTNEIMTLENYLESIIDNMPSILISVDNNGIIDHWNKTAEYILKIKKDEAIGKILWEIDKSFLKYKTIINDIANAKKRHEFLREKLDFNLSKYFNINIFPVKNNNKINAIIRIDDITEIERKEEQLRQAQKMETVGTLAGGIAHDFNNALAGIIGSISLLRFKLNKNNDIDIDTLKKNFEIIEESATHAADIVKHLLSLSRKNELTFLPVDLNNSIKHVYKLCKNSFDKKITIDVKYYDGKLIVNADSTQIEQVLLNLSINAAHAMTIMRKENEPQGGILTLSLSKIYADKHFCSVHTLLTEGEYALITIKDTGVGIPKDIISKIFDPFFTTKGEGVGTGLGLAMAYNIIKQHKGEIDLYSEVGLGTSFHIYLPLVDSECRVDDYNKKNIPKGEGTILIIDDEINVLSIASSILTECGYDILSADNGILGIELYKNNKDKIKAVLLDVAMPKISGKETFLELIKLNPNVKVLISSGYKHDERVEILLQQGAKGFLAKPYNMEMLAQAIYDIIYK